MQVTSTTSAMNAMTSTDSLSGPQQALNQHWPELQQRLEQRGIRLAPLAGQENAAASGGNNGFQQPPQPQAAESDPLFTGAFAQLALNHPALQSRKRIFDGFRECTILILSKPDRKPIRATTKRSGLDSALAAS